MTRIAPPTNPTTGNSASSTERTSDDGQTRVSGSAGAQNAVIEVEHDLGERSTLSGTIDADAEGLRRAHVELEHFTEGGHRFSGKVGTSALSEETQGSVMSKLQWDSPQWHLAGPLSHSASAKVGAFYIPRSRADRNGLDESMTLVGVGARYGLQLDTSIGGEEGVDITGRYGVAADLFIEPAPSAEARDNFTRGMNFSAFDLGKTTGFSDVTLSASSRAAYGVGDRVEVGVTHNIEVEIDDPSIGSVTNDHSATADVSVLSLMGRDQLSAKASVRVPIQDRTQRPDEPADGVISSVRMAYQPNPNLTVDAGVQFRDDQFDAVRAGINYQLRNSVAVGGGYQYNAFNNEHMAYAGVSISFGGGKARSPSASEYMGRHERLIERSDRQRHFTARPPNHRVSPNSVGDMPDVTGLSYEDGMAAIDTPEKAAALLAPGYYFEYGFHEELAKFSPRYSWERRSGVVCAEQHSVQAQALKHNGFEAHNVEYFANSVGHVVTVYKDKETGKWNVLDYNRMYETQADSIKDAMEKFEPGYYEYKVIDYSDTGERTERPRVVEVHRANVVREVRAFWNDQ